MPTSRTPDCKARVLFVAIEMSTSTWKLAMSTDLITNARLRDVTAGSVPVLLAEIAAAKRKLHLHGKTRVVSCFEAGRDGFWLDRALQAQGIENVVVDSSSIEVNRRQRQAKTDRLDALKLLQMLIRWEHGERSVWSVVQVPTPEQEDARHLHRELGSLKTERTAHTNRIKGLLATIGVQLDIDRHFARNLNRLKARDCAPLLPGLKSRLLREFARLRIVTQQIRELEMERAKKVRTQADEPSVQLVRRLMELVGVGATSSWLFVHEVFGWRDIQNRRQLGSLLGLTPTPYSSGNSSRDQSISKSGNHRMRAMATEIAWLWLRYQPSSDLSKWFQNRFGKGSKRQRRIGIVAMTRKLMIAFWKFLRQGEIPGGAVLSESPARFSYTPSLC